MRDRSWPALGTALVQPTYGEVDPQMGGEGGGSDLILVVVFLMQALAWSSVLLALGMLVSARVRTLFWTGGSARRVATTLVLAVGGFFAYNMLS